jgi:hypothetical protein
LRPASFFQTLGELHHQRADLSVLVPFHDDPLHQAGLDTDQFGGDEDLLVEGKDLAGDEDSRSDQLADFRSLIGIHQAAEVHLMFL